MIMSIANMMNINNSEKIKTINIENLFGLIQVLGEKNTNNINKIKELVKLLPEKELTVLTLRYGLKNNNGLKLFEVGKRMKLTRQRVQQIELKALNKIKAFLN
jgi:DNA-directed RNA polymerase sigma subunit (sigma70/sigma32)